jgi:hypothetical protein
MTFRPKNPTASAGSEPEISMLSTRPPKPLRWQQYSSHLHTNNAQNTENGTYIIIKKLNIHNNKKLTNLESAGVTGLCELYPGMCLTTEKKSTAELY